MAFELDDSQSRAVAAQTVDLASIHVIAIDEPMAMASNQPPNAQANPLDDDVVMAESDERRYVGEPMDVDEEHQLANGVGHEDVQIMAHVSFVIADIASDSDYEDGYNGDDGADDQSTDEYESEPEEESFVHASTEPIL